MNYLPRAWRRWFQRAAEESEQKKPASLREFSGAISGGKRFGPIVQEPEGRVIHPAITPVTCRCAVPQPHVHDNRDHWCNSCGGYLGNDARYRKTGVCMCPPCDARGEACTPIYSISQGRQACEVCGSTLDGEDGIIHFSTCPRRFPGGVTA